MDTKTLRTLYAYLAQLSAETISELRKDKIKDKADIVKSISGVGETYSKESEKIKDAVDRLNDSVKSLESTTRHWLSTNLLERSANSKDDSTSLLGTFKDIKDSLEALADDRANIPAILKDVRNAINLLPKQDFTKIEKLLAKIAEKETELDTSILTSNLEELIEEVKKLKNEDVSITVKII